MRARERCSSCHMHNVGNSILESQASTDSALTYIDIENKIIKKVHSGDFRALSLSF